MPSRWLELKHRDALRLLRLGQSYAEVARDLDMHAETVWRWADQAGIAQPRAYRRHTRPFRRRAVARVAAGDSVCSVAREVGISQSLLSRWCDQDGVRSQHLRGELRFQWCDVLLDGRVHERCRRMGPTVLWGRRVLGAWSEVERWRPRVSKATHGRGRWVDGPAAAAAEEAAA